MREWGVEAITYLVKAALQYKYQPPLKDNQVSLILMIYHIIQHLTKLSLIGTLIIYGVRRIDFISDAHHNLIYEL